MIAGGRPVGRQILTFAGRSVVVDMAEPTTRDPNDEWYAERLGITVEEWDALQERLATSGIDRNAILSVIEPRPTIDPALIESLAKAKGPDVVAAMRTKGKTIRNEGRRVGRNEPCPCGCGRKSKLCRGKKRA